MAFAAVPSKSQSGVKVCAAPPPASETNPAADTVKSPESKLLRPIFVASSDPMAWLVWAFIVNVLPDPAVFKGFVPAATVLPKIFQLFKVGDSGPPESPVIVFPRPVALADTKPLPSTVNILESKCDTPFFFFF